MTARQVFEATLIELSKIQAPSLKLYEFNYLFNKAINQYINKVYNVYDINQQTTDDLRVLKSTCYLTPHKVQLGADNRALRNVIVGLGGPTNGVPREDHFDITVASEVMAVLPMESLKLIIIVPLGTGLIPESAIAQSVMYSLVSPVQRAYEDISDIETHL